MSAPEKMSDEQIAGTLGFSVMTPNAIAYLAMGRAIEAARDAQWQARLDAAVMEERAACAQACEDALTLHGVHSNFICARYIKRRTT
jgi:histidinol-phosphate/aromatic aminotransferase/cobyric acid decarboxylase-like protein